MTGLWTKAWVGVLLAGLLAAGGCAQWEQTPGRSRELGSVSMPRAFAASREVLSAHFPIAEADPATRTIKTLPKLVDAPAERLMGRSEARQVGTLRLREEEGQVVAHLSIAQQRKGGQAVRNRVLDEENYSGRPRTPAHTGGAIEPSQDDDWQVYGYDHRLESVILAEIYRTLHASSSPSAP
ncbi:MAG: hypothetical protein ACOCZU_02960 [Planctomycetota bacterium]